MPTYDYQCDACGHAFEAYQSITAPPLRVCPECKSRRLRRLLGTGAALLFKGNGFYQTDYRSSSYKEAAKAEQASSSGDKKAKEAPSLSSGKSDSAGKTE